MTWISAFLQYSYEDDAFANMTFAEGNSTTLADDVPNRTIQGLQITPMRQVNFRAEYHIPLMQAFLYYP